MLPYAVMTSLTLLLYFALRIRPPYADVFSYRVGFEWSVAGFLENFRAALLYLATGLAQQPYWYMPFIAAMFLLSPLFLAFSRLAANLQIALVLLGLTAASMVHRPLVYAPNLLHNLLYFSPVYMLGIVYALRRHSIDNWLKVKWYIPLGIVVGCAALQAKYYLWFGLGNLHKANLFAFDRIDIMLFQKVALCLLLIAILNGFGEMQFPWLRLVGSASFALYFLHPFVQLGLTYVGFERLIGSFVGNWALFLIKFPIVVLTSLGLAFLVRLLIKHRSRAIIGW